MVALSLGAVVVAVSVAGPATARGIDAEPPTTPDVTIDAPLVATGADVEPVAEATLFTPGYLINDHIFYNPSGMTQGQIQSFLNSMQPSCGNSNCLKLYTQSTTTRPADVRCAEYTGAANESAAAIIYKVQVACGINAKVLLVTLQKEQSLITSTAPSDTRLRIAMGYGCPDTAACETRYYGFQNQVYSAASQFQRYRQNPGGYRHIAGQTIALATHPRSFYPNSDFVPAQCPFITATIRNDATAGLYNYTPYTPNASALANLYGTGDTCASYGNRNFWRLFTDWFGSPTIASIPTATQVRINGANRFETSVQLSQRAYPGGASTVYVAVGSQFADGLAAAPAAAQVDAPLLLVGTDSVLPVVTAELRRLNPTSIVIVGGPGAVSPSVAATLAAAVPTATISRFQGLDRFGTARDIAAQGFPTGAPIVFLASGANFPDALAASAAAGSLGGPVLLVPGGATAVDPQTRALIESLGASTIVIAGGTGVVSSALELDARSIPGVTTVERRGGSNRFETAALLNQYAFTDASAGFIASGFDFPDALSAAAIAGAQGAPLALSNGICTFVTSLDQFIDFAVTSVTLVGGTGVLGPSVGQYETCG